MLHLLTVLSVTIQAAAGPAATELRGADLMAALRTGGYTVLVRHARTDRSIPTKETPGNTPQLRADQRNLTADGERDVRLMADVVRNFAWPVGEVLSSPVYRCRETADAFGTPSLTQTLRTWPTTSETAALVAAAPKAGTNRVLVTHHFVIENHVPGIRPGDIGESGAVVVRPDGTGGVELVGRILLADWEALAGAQSVVTVPSQPATTSPIPPDSSVTIPPTRVGQLAVRYIDAFNSGDTARMRTFTERFMAPVPDRPTDVRVRGYMQLFEQHARLTVTGLESSSSDTLAVRVRSARGDLTMRFIADAHPSYRVQSVTFISTGRGHS